MTESNPITFPQTNPFHFILNVQLVTEQLLTAKCQRSSSSRTVAARHVRALQSEGDFREVHV